jgi:hypothetical protein
LSDNHSQAVRILRKGTLLLAVLLFLGLVVLPVAVFFVGQVIFGDYGGRGFGQFFLDLSGRVRSGDGGALFLVLSPYLAWQAMRLIGLGWRLTQRPRPPQR